MFEQLEARRLFSATLANGLLTVEGTSGDDVIIVYTKPTAANGFDDPRVFVRVNGVDQGDFDWQAVTQIRVDALGGNDLVDLHSGGNVAGGRDTGNSAHIEGGAGSDTLIGGAGNDTLVGGSHSDVLRGNDGNDLLSGGNGNDLLVGAAGTEARFDGDDTLGGGNGDDTLSGDGRGSDTFEGGRGTDTVDYSTRSDNLLIVLGSIKLPDLWPVENRTVVDGQPIDHSHDYIAQPYPDFDPHKLHGTGYLEGDFIQDDVENATGGPGNDILWGNDRVNVLDGKAGNDQIYGGLGTDAMYGGDGDDRLFAADESDAMPAINPVVFHERIQGDAGRDYAMIDFADAAGTGVDTVEKIETLPALTS